MNKALALSIRSKILAVLVRDAREAAGKSKKETADILGISSSGYNSLEDGTTSPSLPDLEMLSYFFGVSISHFWSDDIMSDDPTLIDDIEIEENLRLRNRAIGRILSSKRDRSGLTLAQIQEDTGISPNRLRKFEAGEAGVPLPELEELLGLYDISRYDLIDSDTPIGRWLIEQHTLAEFHKLPLKMQEFVSKPVNLPYMEIALKLSKLSAKDLRDIAEILLEVTL